MHVVDIGGSKSLKTIVERTFNTALTESQGYTSGQRNLFPVRACQVIGTAVNSNVDWSVTEPIADISHCSTFIGEMHTPIMLVVPLEFLRNVGSGSLFATTLRNLRIDAQQSPLQVILADEAESEEDQDENDTVRSLDTLMKKVLSCSYNMYYWKASQQRFSVQFSCQGNIADAMKETAIKHIQSTAMASQFMTLEKDIISQRKQGVRVLFPEEFTVLAKDHTDDQSMLLGILQLERKGLVVRGSSNASRSKKEEKKFASRNDSCPLFLILQPMWFYGKANSLIHAVFDRRTREDATLVPSVRNRAFYSRKTVADIAAEVRSDCSPTDQQAFMEALQYHGIVIM